MVAADACGSVVTRGLPPMGDTGADVDAGATIADLPNAGVVAVFAAASGALPVTGIAVVTVGVAVATVGVAVVTAVFIETRCALAETWRT